jgi:hypothetical protein
MFRTLCCHIASDLPATIHAPAKCDCGFRSSCARTAPCHPPSPAHTHTDRLNPRGENMFSLLHAQPQEIICKHTRIDTLPHSENAHSLLKAQTRKTFSHTLPDSEIHTLSPKGSEMHTFLEPHTDMHTTRTDDQRALKRHQQHLRACNCQIVHIRLCVCECACESDLFLGFSRFGSVKTHTCASQVYFHMIQYRRWYD